MAITHKMPFKCIQSPISLKYAQWHFSCCKLALNSQSLYKPIALAATESPKNNGATLMPNKVSKTDSELFIVDNSHIDYRKVFKEERRS